MSLPDSCGSWLAASPPSPEIFTLRSATSRLLLKTLPSIDTQMGSLTRICIPNIIQYSTLKAIILQGDFNACTGTRQIPLQDRLEDALCLQEIELASVGFHNISDDAMGPLSAYGRHLHLDESHDFLS